jgi:hypothetical protein
VFRQRQRIVGGIDMPTLCRQSDSHWVGPLTAVRARRAKPGGLGLRWASLASEGVWVMEVLSSGQLTE